VDADLLVPLLFLVDIIWLESVKELLYGSKVVAIVARRTHQSYKSFPGRCISIHYIYTGWEDHAQKIHAGLVRRNYTLVVYGKEDLDARGLFSMVG